MGSIYVHISTIQFYQDLDVMDTRNVPAIQKNIYIQYLYKYTYLVGIYWLLAKLMVEEFQLTKKGVSGLSDCDRNTMLI